MTDRQHTHADASSAPDGYTTVAPWVVTDDTGAFLDFVAAAFGGEELGRVVTEGGAIGHGEIRVGDTVVLAFDRSPDWPVLPSLLRVFVPDADQAFARAVDAGAQVVTPSPITPSDSAAAGSRTPSAPSGGWSPRWRTSPRPRCGNGCGNPSTPRPCASPRRPSTPNSAAGATAGAARPYGRRPADRLTG